MACPHVVGTAALVKVANHDWTNNQIRARLQQTADDLGTAGRDTLYGYGLVDADGAVGSTVNTPPVAEAGPDQNATVGQSVSFNGSGSTDSDGTIVSYAWNFGDDSTGTGATVTHIYSAAGTYTATLTVTDNSGATGSDTATVNVTETAIKGMHVSDIIMSTKVTRQNVAAIANVKVVDSGGNPVSGATVSGHWTGATTDRDTGITSGTGQIALQSNNVKKPRSGTTLTFTFTIDSVIAAGCTYDSVHSITTNSTKYP